MKKVGIIIVLLSLIFTQLSYANDIITTDEIVIVNGEIVENRSQNSEDDVKTITPVTNRFNKLTDYPNGYSVNYPNDMYVDIRMSPVQNTLFNEAMKIEIYYDDMNNTLANAWNYIYYSNGFLSNQTDHFAEEEKIFIHNGYSIHTLKWHRNKLAKVENDKNHYLSAVIIKNNKEVYSLFFKSSEPLDETLCFEIIKSFKITDKTGKPYMSKLPGEGYVRNWNDETQAFYNDYFINSDKLTWGIFDNYAPDFFEHYRKTEELLNFNFDFLVKYQNLPEDSNLEAIKESLEKAYEENRYVELTLQTSRLNEEDGNMVYDILDGKYHDFFEEYSEMLKSFGKPVMFRLNNEMNGDWCVYSSYHTSKDTDIYKELYRYVFKTFEANGVDNVLWIWNPHDISFPNFKWNHALNYYPGDNFVDIVGMTGYNTGNYYPGEVWRGFQEIYDPLYLEYDGIFNKPFMITEFGSNSFGGSKEKWVQEMFENISKYERIKAAIWWNGCDYDSQGRAARIYRLDESPYLINIFRKELQKFIK